MVNQNLTKKHLDDLTYQIIGAAIEVHKVMGRGLLESVYHECMKHELMLRGINFITEFKIVAAYKEKELDLGFRGDLFVENCIVLELKAAAEISPINEAQILTYMKLTKAPKGIILNFNCTNIFADGQRTYVNEHFRNLP